MRMYTFIDMCFHIKLLQIIYVILVGACLYLFPKAPEKNWVALNCGSLV